MTAPWRGAILERNSFRNREEREWSSRSTRSAAISWAKCRGSTSRARSRSTNSPPCAMRSTATRVLVFHDQKITDEQQIAFTRNFGEIENSAGGNITRRTRRRLAPRDERRLQPRHGRTSRSPATTAGGCSISATASGIPTAPSARSRRNTRSSRAAPSSTRAATPNSPTCAPPTTRSTTTTKAEIEDLVCEHSLMYSRGSLGFTDSPTRRGRCSARCASAWCARIR